MALFSITAEIHSNASRIVGGEEETYTNVASVAVTSEFPCARDAFLHLVQIAGDARGWIAKSKIMPADKETGEIHAPIHLLAPPKPTVCPLSELTVVIPKRIAEVAIKEPYTYKGGR